MKRLSFLIGLMLPLGWATTMDASDQIPGPPQPGPIAISGGTLHTISGDVIQGGTLLFNEGKIVAIGRNVDLPSDVLVLDATGKHVYPGLIEAHSDIGLVEINSIRATVDSRETGTLNPNVQAAVAFNPDSELIPVARANGILSALSAPTGGLISGRSSLMLLDGWTRNDMTLAADTGMHVRWSSGANGSLSEVFNQALRYAAARSTETEALDGVAQPRDLRLEAVVRVLDGEMPLIVQADDVADLRSAVAFKSQFSIDLIIAGGADAGQCAELLRKDNVPVIVSAVYRNPSRRNAAYDEAYTLPKRLQDAGVTYCISAGGRFGANGIRNLPYNAATAAAYGLSEPQALRAITLSPAEILGVDDRIGSLRVGLDATLIIADGNILETPTNVEMAFIQGRQVDLSSRHTQLYDKYRRKYAR